MIEIKGIMVDEHMQVSTIIDKFWKEFQKAVLHK